jgi:putative ABC transport system ATP-binding protein
VFIEAVDLSKRYATGAGSVAALDTVSFGIDKGEFVAVMGPSGSGKTTLMNLLGLLDRPTSGRLTLAGEDASRLSADRQAALRNRHIGFVFQSYNLLHRSTAIENVELPLVYAGVPRAERQRRAGQALERVGLSKRRDHWPVQLSGGEQQRVAIARAMVSDPALILADEPTGALDSHTGLEILALFQAINDAGSAILMVTHDETVARYARRILRMKDGRLEGDTPVTERSFAPPLQQPGEAAS